MSDAVGAVLIMNLAAASAVLAVLLLRLPARKLFGARVAYGLWALPPLAAAALLLPAPELRVPPPAPAAISAAVPAIAATPLKSAVGRALPSSAAVEPVETKTPQRRPTRGVPPGALLFLWTLGALASLGHLAWRQARFARAARQGSAGPAVVGVLRPRIVAPHDFEDRYTPGEREVVLAHEQTHLARWDARANAAMALARCLFWFNPMLHAMSHFLRIDQELACDAEVVARHPKARRTYAEAMLKTQLAAQPLPLGCYWPAQSAHPLAERIRLLGRADPGGARRFAGSTVVMLLTVAGAWSAYAARGPDVVYTAPEVRLRQAETAASAAPLAAFRQAREDTLAAERAQRRPVRAAVTVVTPPPQPAAPPPAAEFKPPPGYVLVPAAALNQPVVEPGYAILLETHARAPDGRDLESKRTSYGSGTGYSTGSYSNHGSRYGLRTKVVQQGDKVHAFVSLTWGERVLGSGMATLASGETAEIVLDNGQVVTVRPTIRLETRDEFATARMELRRIRP